MKPSRILRPGGMIAFLAGISVLMGLALAAGHAAQDGGLVGFVAKDRVMEMAAAADASVASFAPSEMALASFVGLVDPVHIRMFFRPGQPGDLVLAAKVGRAFDAAANPVLSVEFVAVADDLSEPKAVISENAVTAAPEIVVSWMGGEIGRMHPEAGSAVDDSLADFIFNARLQIHQEMILDREFFRFTYHKDLLALDCKRCHGPAKVFSELPGPLH